MLIMRYIIIIVVILGCYSCKNDDTPIFSENSLAALVAQYDIEIDNVIACASGSKTDENTIIAYAYPRPGASNLQYFETFSTDDDKNDYRNYTKVSIEATDFFNGYLKKFTRINTGEKWVIITFFEDNKLHLSNPIRLKHLSKPTEFSETVTVDTMLDGMPVFGWDDGVFNDNKIYFQVISDVENNFISGTYTFEKQFQYYKLDNVVLNITQGTPPVLNSSNQFNFTLMGVSEDNWVNLFIEKKFTP